MDTDRDTRVVRTSENIAVPAVRLGTSRKSKEQQLARAARDGESRAWEHGDLARPDPDRASRRPRRTKDRRRRDLNNDPPRILFLDEPAVLVTIDGEPKLAPVENYELMRVVNSPSPIVLYHEVISSTTCSPATSGSRAGGRQGGRGSCSERDAGGGFASLFQVDWEGEPPEPMESRSQRIVVATEPTELIVSGRRADVVARSRAASLLVDDEQRQRRYCSR